MSISSDRELEASVCQIKAGVYSTNGTETLDSNHAKESKITQTHAYTRAHTCVYLGRCTHGLTIVILATSIFFLLYLASAHGHRVFMHKKTLPLQMQKGSHSEHNIVSIY